MEIPVRKDYYEEGQVLYPFKSIKVEHPVVCLTGCNGSGKSTMVRQITDHLKTLGFQESAGLSKTLEALHSIFQLKDEEPKGLWVLFDITTDPLDSFDEGDIAIDHFFQTGLSNGETVNYRLTKTASLIGGAFKKAKEKGIPLWLFFDDCDSGTSIDMIIDIKNFILMVDGDLTKHGVEHQIIVTSNSYEMCRDLPCLCVQTGKMKTFKTYESFKKFVLWSRGKKNKREEANRERGEDE